MLCLIINPEPYYVTFRNIVWDVWRGFLIRDESAVPYHWAMPLAHVVLLEPHLNLPAAFPQLEWRQVSVGVG